MTVVKGNKIQGIGQWRGRYEEVQKAKSGHSDNSTSKAPNAFEPHSRLVSPATFLSRGRVLEMEMNVNPCREAEASAAP
jgi:hypothetical protein